MKTYKITKGNTPVIVHIPHNGFSFPYFAQPEDASLRQEALYDSMQTLADLHVNILQKELFERLQQHSNVVPYLFESTVSRLYMDPERFPDHREEMNSRGMGVIYTKNHNMEDLYDAPLTTNETLHRMTMYGEYHTAFEQLVETLLEQFGHCVILDLHSYSTEPLLYELHSDQPRTPLVLGTDTFHSTMFQEVLSLEYDWMSINTVFQGTFVPMKYYHHDSRVQSIMTEVRKDVYLDEQTQQVEQHALFFPAVVNILEMLTLEALSEILPTEF